MYLRSSILFRLKTVLVAGFCLLPAVSFAQFLRLGPFDFNASTELEFIYTTNVELERESEATEEREDYYAVWRLDLDAVADVTYNSTLTLSTGIAIEKHFVRDDLDNSEEPFGELELLWFSDLDPLFIEAGYRIERTSDSIDDKFVPADRPSKRRQIGTTEERFVLADIIGKRLEMGASYEYTKETYDNEDFRDEEQIEEVYTYYIKWNFTEKFAIGYEIEETETEFINTGEMTDEKVETITLDFDQILTERPQITYRLGVERETTDGESDGWELVHTFELTDEYESGALRWDYYVTYEIEDNPEEDDIALEYGVNIEHDISRRTMQTFSAKQEPTDTFGSTEDTKSTEFRYGLEIDDFVFYDFMFDAGVTYTIDEPVDGDTEKIWEYEVTIEYVTQLGPSFTRTWLYEYSLEDSDLEDEVLDEHRLTLNYKYQF